MNDVGAIQGVTRLLQDAMAGTTPAASRARPQDRPKTNVAKPQPATPAPEVADTAPAEVRDQLQQRLAGYDVQVYRAENSPRWVIQIRDRASGKVVFEIPPERVAKLRGHPQELLKDTGLLVDYNL